ncbi:MAG: hypothetical protein KatS3mg119_2426 [Rhodothalassiaceae bacterium]|nr:MAG: hypothetical protein KatS3mg119_2426 [Rhodothalassiaceae bacterium]
MRRAHSVALLAALLLLAGGAASAATLWVGAKEDDRLVAIDLASGEIRARLPTGAGPHEVAVSPDGRRVAVVAYGRRGAPAETPRDIVDVFDAATSAHPARIPLAPYGSPHGIAWMDDGRHLLVTAERDRRLLIVDAASRTVADAVDTGAAGSHLLARDPRRPRAYVTSLGDGVVSVIDLEARRLVKTVPSGRQAEGVAVTPDGEELWVTNRAEDTVAVFALPGVTRLATITSAGVPIRVAFSPDGRLAAVSNARAGTVVLFDRATRRPLRTIGFKTGDVPPLPVGLLFHPDGGRLYVALTGPGEIAEVAVADGRILRRFAAGAGADGMAISPLAFSGT